MALDTYIPVPVRIAKFKADHGHKGTIETEITINYDKAVALSRAVLKIEDKIVATGHSLADLEEGEKALEKGESVAIGRALVNAGYEADSGEGGADDSDAEEKSSRFSKSDSSKSKEGRFSRSSKKEESREDEEEKEEAEEKESDSAKEEDAEKSEQKEESESPGSNGKSTKIADLMAKYGATKGSASTSSNLRR